MSTPQEFLSELRQRGAGVELDAGELEVYAPEDVLSPEDLIFLREHRGPIVALLVAEQGSSEARSREVIRRIAAAQAAAKQARPDGYHWALDELGPAGSAEYERAFLAEAAFDAACGEYIETGLDDGRMRAAWLDYLAAIRKPAETQASQPQQANATPS